MKAHAKYYLRKAGVAALFIFCVVFLIACVSGPSIDESIAADHYNVAPEMPDQELADSIVNFYRKKQLMGLFIDDQRKLDPVTRSLVNPAPVERDFVGNNAKHKILMAIIDHGVDYNHPAMFNNIHFTLDDKGRPVRLGSDLIGNDNWPAPYIGRDNPESDRYELWVVNQMIGGNTEVANYLNPRRAVLREYLVAASHGQKVSSVMVKDRPDFGLLVYRYGPLNYAPGKQPVDYYTEAMENIIRCARQAIADGAKIIVIPSTWYGIVEDDGNPESSDEADKIVAMWQEKCREFQALALLNPEKLFVVPLGNNNGRIVPRNNDRHINFIAGIDAPNIVPVGAVDRNGDYTSLTNIAADELNAVYVLGEDVVVDVPTHMAVPPANFAMTYMQIMDSINEGNETYASIGRIFPIFAADPERFSREDGTSISVGMYGKFAAEVLVDENPLYTIAQVIQRVEEKINSGLILGKVHKAPVFPGMTSAR